MGLCMAGLLALSLQTPYIGYAERGSLDQPSRQGLVPEDYSLSSIMFNSRAHVSLLWH
jgi:hypothetical protein